MEDDNFQNIEEKQNSSVNLPRKVRVMMNQSLFDLTKRLKHQNVKASRIVEITGLSKSAVHKALAKIDENPDSSFSMLYGQSGRPKKQNPVTVRNIKEILANDQSLTQEGVQTKMLETHNEILSSSAIFRLLKEGGLKRKRLKKKASVIATELHQERLRLYAMDFVRYRTRDIVFLDETGFNLHSSINYGYAEAGISSVAHVPATKGQNMSACCIISRFGLTMN